MDYSQDVEQLDKSASFEYFDQLGSIRSQLKSPIQSKNPLNSQNSPPPLSKTERELLRYQCSSSQKPPSMIHDSLPLQDIQHNNYYDKNMASN